MTTSIIPRHKNMNGKLCRPIILNGDYSNQQLKIIKTAFNYLQDCPVTNKSRHISIISFKGEIVEAAVNKERSFYGHKPFGYQSIHSEYNVVRKFLRSYHANELNDFDLYNVRISRYNQPVNSKPCKRCQYFLGIFRPHRIFFTGESGRFEQWLN